MVEKKKKNNQCGRESNQKKIYLIINKALKYSIFFLSYYVCVINNSKSAIWNLKN